MNPILRQQTGRRHQTSAPVSLQRTAPRPHVRAAVVAIAAVVTALLASAAPAVAATLDAKLVPSSGAHFGVMAPSRDGRSASEEMLRLERLIGRTYDLDRWYYRWDDTFPGIHESEAAAAGRIPLIGWTALTKAGTHTKWGAIASGAHDATIARRADAAKAYGRKFMLIFHHEPEDDLAKNGTAAEYRAAWRRIVTTFRNRGATNVVFVWNMMAYTFNPNGKSPEDFYPGNDVVDWVAADGYNWFGSSHIAGQPWREFREIFAAFSSWTKAKGKPGMMAEFGSLEDTITPDPQRKARWLSNMASTLKAWPHIKGIAYFQGKGWHFDSSLASLNAYRTVAQDGYFNPRGSGTSTGSAPTVQVTNPADGSAVEKESTVRTAASASDDVGVKQVDFYVNGTQRCTDTAAPYSCDWTVWTAAGTTNAIKAVARDGSGNATEDSVAVKTAGDVTKPTVSILTPANGTSVLYKSIVPITASASDDVGVAKVAFEVNGILRCTDAAAPYSCNWTAWTAPGKTNAIKATAYDAAGNAASHAVSVTTR